MSTDKPDVLYPRYYQQFSCIGPECENDCCHGWRVPIDSQTYETYQKSSDIRIVEVSEKMTRLHSIQNDKDVRCIKFNNKKRCPLQNDDGSCYVHSRYGQDMLSKTCRTYPRMIYLFNDAPRPTLSLSCPEAARRILLDPHAMDLVPGPAIADNLNTSNVADIPPWLDDLQRTALQAVAYKTRTPDERFFHLGVLIQRVAESMEREENVQKTCTDFLQMQDDGVIAQRYSALEPQPEQLALVVHKLITEARFFLNNSVLSDYHTQFMENMAKQYGLDGNIDLEDLITSRQFALEQLFLECGDGLVNMIKHWIYGDDLSTSKGKLLLRRYSLFVLKYLLIRFYLLALAEKDHGPALLVGIVHSFSRSSDHDPLFMLKLYVKLSELDGNSHDNMMALLKTT